MIFRLTALLLSIALLGATQLARAQENAQAPDDFSDLSDGAEASEGQAPDPSEQPAPDPARLKALERIEAVIEALDPNAVRTANNWQFTLDESQVMVVTDVTNDRMRIITPIAMAAALSPEALRRLLQADFDSALDARYAIAQDLVWGTFIHPLESLTTREFASGVLQTKSLADTFGTSFSSGALTYGGGDSTTIIEEQLKELLEELEKGNET